MACQHRARFDIVGRCSDNSAHSGKEAVHQGLIKTQEQALLDNVGMISDERRLAAAMDEMQKIGHRPGKMIVDDVDHAYQGSKLGENRKRHARRGKFEIALDRMDMVPSDLRGNQLWMFVESENMIFDA